MAEYDVLEQTETVLLSDNSDMQIMEDETRVYA
jgi:hypothetical protein